MKRFIISFSGFLLLGFILNLLLAYVSSRYAYRYPREELRIQQLFSKTNSIDALSVGNSHAQSLDFATLGYNNGYAIWQGGGDVFEAEYQLKALLPRLPNVKTVFFAISYFTFHADNATIPNRLVMRRRDYVAIPSFSWVDGDFGNFFRTKFFPIVREDHWEEVFYAMVKGKKNYSLSTLEESLGVNSYGQLIDKRYLGQPLSLDALTTLTREVEVPEQLHLNAEMVENHPTLVQDVYKTLVSIIKSLQDRNIRIIFYTPPYFYLYSELYDQEMIAVMKHNMDTLQEDFGVEYYDLSTDPTIAPNHLLFYDDDHLNKDGATAFSQKLKHVILERLVNSQK